MFTNEDGDITMPPVNQNWKFIGDCKMVILQQELSIPYAKLILPYCDRNQICTQNYVPLLGVRAPL